MNRPIGVCDAGLGGLTVVAEMQKLLPNENIVYYGDSKRNPYGNHTKEKIVSMSCEIFDFLKTKNVKAIVIACNTISTLIDSYKHLYDLPIIGIVEPVSKYIAKQAWNPVGIIATNATINSSAYNYLINKYNSDIKVYGKGSKWLAKLIDSGNATDNEINEEIKENMDELLKMATIKKVVLGCTHYPINIANFINLYPEIEYINPAYFEALEIQDILTKNQNLAKQDTTTFEIYTSGDNLDTYKKIAAKLECNKIDKIEKYVVGE